MSLKDLKVSQKVVLAFAGVLLATVLLGVFALVRLSAVKTTADMTALNSMPTTEALARFQYASTRFRAFQASWIMPITAEERENHVKTFAKLNDAIGAALKDYRALANSPKEVELAGRLEEAWSGYYALKPEYEQIFADKGIEAATEYLEGPSRKAFTVIVKTTEEAIKDNSAVAKAYVADAQSTYDSARLWIIGVIIAAGGIALVAGVWLIRSVSKPLGAMTEAMDELAKGNTEVPIPHADQVDEIGHLAGSMAAFKEQLAAAERAKAEQTKVIVESIGAGLSYLAEGDLTHRVESNLTGAFAKLKDDFNTSADRLQETVRGGLDSTHQIATGAGEISNAADDLSRRTEQQAASLEETAAALEEVAASAKMAASNSQEASRAITTTKTVAEEGGQVVEAAVRAMDAISQSSKQVTDIIGVIDEIAFQTNLLALNAGVEAARAGDAGKGFAVVASEVRALAQRSSEAAKQIKSLIHASGEHVGEGVKLVGASGAALKRIIEQVVEIDKLARGSADAGQQQAAGIQEVNSAVSQMDQATQQNAAMVEQSTAASRNLAHETQHLQELVGFFNVGGAAVAPRVDTPAPRVSAPKPIIRAAPRKAATRVAVNAGPVASAPSGDGWEEF